MEQTSSSAYPNILVVDYVKKARVASPQLLMKAEHYLNVGYQKLLTFERPGGGFDWWGSGEPEVWLSAYVISSGPWACRSTQRTSCARRLSKRS